MQTNLSVVERKSVVIWGWGGGKEWVRAITRGLEGNLLE